MNGWLGLSFALDASFMNGWLGLPRNGWLGLSFQLDASFMNGWLGLSVASFATLRWELDKQGLSNSQLPARVRRCSFMPSPSPLPSQVFLLRISRAMWSLPAANSKCKLG